MHDPPIVWFAHVHTVRKEHDMIGTIPAVHGGPGEVKEPRRGAELPGELKPLVWHPGRGPITDEETLGVMRRRKRVDLAGRPRSTTRRGRVPEELPAEGAPKKPAVFRLPPRALGRAHARAEMEGIPLTTILEEFLLSYASGQPESPESVVRRIGDKRIKWQRR